MRVLGLAVLIATLSATPASSAFAQVPVQGYQVVRTYPHDPTAFTEGLVFHDGQLIESTGEYPSDIRMVRLEDGAVLKRRVLNDAFFGEGVVPLGDRLISLTWQNQIGFIWALDDLSPLGAFPYSGEGWALTSDGERLIMSDGTDQLRFLDPDTLAETGRLSVTADGEPVYKLNELEWIPDPDGGGEIYANVWGSNRIARIDPETGHVVAWIDLTGIMAGVRADPVDDVLNGIAWDNEAHRLFVTGKRWPSLFEIRLTPVTTEGR